MPEFAGHLAFVGDGGIPTFHEPREPSTQLTVGWACTRAETNVSRGARSFEHRAPALHRLEHLVVITNTRQTLGFNLLSVRDRRPDANAFGPAKGRCVVDRVEVLFIGGLESRVRNEFRGSLEWSSPHPLAGLRTSSRAPFQPLGSIAALVTGERASEP